MSVNKAYVEKLLLDVERSISVVTSYTSKPYENMSEAERYAVRYNIIVIAEALASLALHIARRLYNEEPETPMHAFSILRDKGLITSSEQEDFARLTRLRNLLVHRYWTVDDEKVYASVKSDFKSVKNFIERLRILVVRSL